MATFGELVRDLRKARDISQAKLAEKAGISDGYVGLIEIGQRGQRPSLEVVKKIAGALETTEDETEQLLRATGHLGEDEKWIISRRPTVLDAVRSDRRLTRDQKQLMIDVYQQLVRFG
jgi:transcriptional regulator with XRE-family HTH domain